MGGHVVWPFGIVLVEGPIFGDELGKKGCEVGQDIRVGIFLDDQTRRGVTHEERAESDLDIGPSDHLGHLRCNFMQAFAAGADVERSLMVLHENIC